MSSSSQPQNQHSDTTLCIPLVYGSIATPLPKPDESNTHEWTLFVRGPQHEDLSPLLHKVVFTLHASFAQPTREYTQPPYQVTERGWGEFEAQIQLVWKEKAPTAVSHLIRLYPSSPSSSPIVVAESYDEVVVTSPSSALLQAAQQQTTTTLKEDYAQHEHMTLFSDATEALALVQAQTVLQEQLVLVRAQLNEIERTT